MLSLLTAKLRAYLMHDFSGAHECTKIFQQIALTSKLKTMG